MSPAMVVATGDTPPAPSPWRARARMSCGKVRAKPQRIEPTRKIATEIW